MDSAATTTPILMACSTTETKADLMTRVTAVK